MRGLPLTKMLRSCALFVMTSVLFLAPSAQAEVQLLEAVGVAPVPAGELASRDTRDAAVQAALREAVLSVARQLMDAMPEEGGGQVGDAQLSAVLGERVLPYTTRYKIVDDQGERPPLFKEGRELASEYVVVVEVSVEAELVEQRLIAGGLLVGEPSDGETSRIRVEVRGLLHYPAHAAMRELLSGIDGAVSVTSTAFSRGVAVLEVEVVGAVEERDREAWAARIVEKDAPELAIELLALDLDRIVLAAAWTPPPPFVEDDAAPAPRGK